MEGIFREKRSRGRSFLGLLYSPLLSTRIRDTFAFAAQERTPNPRWVTYLRRRRRETMVRRAAKTRMASLRRRIPLSPGLSVPIVHTGCTMNAISKQRMVFSVAIADRLSLWKKWRKSEHRNSCFVLLFVIKCTCCCCWPRYPVVESCATLWNEKIKLRSWMKGRDIRNSREREKRMNWVKIIKVARATDTWKIIR